MRLSTYYVALLRSQTEHDKTKRTGPRGVVGSEGFPSVCCPSRNGDYQTEVARYTYHNHCPLANECIFLSFDAVEASISVQIISLELAFLLQTFCASASGLDFSISPPYSWSTSQGDPRNIYNHNTFVTYMLRLLLHVSRCSAAFVSRNGSELHLLN